MMRHALAPRIAAMLGLWAVLNGSLAAMSANEEGQRAVSSTPIIAEVFSQPDEFLGRRVAIYGLVVEARNHGQRFLLQDVSQMPLFVVSPPGQRVAAGSQLMVFGILRHAEGELELASDDLLAVQVVAGGGCC